MSAEWVEMSSSQHVAGNEGVQRKGSDDVGISSVPSHNSSSLHATTSGDSRLDLDPRNVVVYRVYKRRFFGLVQLSLLNIIVSWNWLTFSALSLTSAEYFQVSETAINWLSTGFLFAFVAISPVVLWTLNKGGAKSAIVAASVLIFIGNWIRYAGARASGPHFGVVVFGQVLIGFAQPFVLAAPTRYSDTWFTSKGRITATAIASLANPFGAALAQLIDPFWATKPSEVPNMILYISLIATVASIPSFFIPAGPPTPPCRSAEDRKVPLMTALKTTARSVEFWLLFIPFTVYVSLFNAFSSLTNQFLEPYGFSEAAAGICGAFLILVGLLTSAITSPITSQHRRLQLPLIKLCVPLLGLSYIAFIFAPSSGSIFAPDIIASVLGAASFALVPVVLEFVAEVTHPVGPEISSTLYWTGGQLGGGIAIVVMGALRAGPDASPPRNMHRALVLQAVVAALAIPIPLCLGLFGRAEQVKPRRADGIGDAAGADVGVSVEDGADQSRQARSRPQPGRRPTLEHAVDDVNVDSGSLGWLLQRRTS